MVFFKKLLVAGVALTLLALVFISVINVFNHSSNVRLQEEQEVTRFLLRNNSFDKDPRTVRYKSDLSFFDMKTVEGKSFEDVDGLQEDGTYLLLHDDFHRGPTEACMPMVEEQDRIKRVHYHFSYCGTFDDMFGNRLALLYGMKMVAYAMNKPFTFSCGHSEGKEPLGAAYLMKLNTDVPGPVTNRNGEEFTAEQVCRDYCAGHYCNWYFSNLDLASDAMIEDWKYLASPAVVSIEDYDDAVIHLRLGDGLYSTVGNNEGKGVFPHATYVNLLKQAEKEKGRINSIGIVTAPFKGDKLRQFDKGYTSLSEDIALALIRALQESFPKAQIRLHNSPESTIIESMARLVNAPKVAVCGCSTLCPSAVLATKGIGYIYKPVGAQNDWVRNAAMWHPNFRLFETPMLNGMVIASPGWALERPHIFGWMMKQDPLVGNVDIDDAPIFRNREDLH